MWLWPVAHVASNVFVGEEEGDRGPLVFTTSQSSQSVGHSHSSVSSVSSEVWEHLTFGEHRLPLPQQVTGHCKRTPCQGT